MRMWLAAAVTTCLLSAAAAAQEANYPSKPVTIIVPAAPGGVTDALGRTLAQHFTEAWGQQVIVENKPGANKRSRRNTSPRRRPTATRCSSGRK